MTGRSRFLLAVTLGVAVILALALMISPHNRILLKQQVERLLAMRPMPKPQWPTEPIGDRLQAAGFALGQPVLLRVFKEESILELWMQRTEKFERVFSYPICRWSGALGPKLQEGDRQSPEGYYFASEKQLLPSSRHHRAINTGFPNSLDKSYGRTGSVLMIHGACSSIGCYAMTDPAIDDIYTIVEHALANRQQAIPMHLYPFRMTQDNLARHKDHPWIDFWRNLAEGDALFAKTARALDVWSCGGKYHFAEAPQNCQKVSGW
jgi:murein L,D-transpeptidase YafK